MADNGAEVVEKPNRQTAKKARKAKAKRAKKLTHGGSRQTRSNVRRPYPRETLERALSVPKSLREKNGGNPWPPVDVATSIGLSHTNSDFFYLAAASRDFGLTDGGRDSKLISLTSAGRDAVYAPGKDEERAALIQALLKVDIFRKVLDYYKGDNLPEMQYLGNTLVREFGLDESLHEEFSKLFRENCKFLGIGAGFTSEGPLKTDQIAKKPRENTGTVVLAEPSRNTGLKCFAIMPFGEREATRSKGFFDEVLRALIAPAGRDAGFEVLTANRDGSDVIHATIVNQLLDADLVVADLTENNPNVLFELGLRIAEDKPVALIRAKGTAAIFDVDNMLRVFEYDPNLWSSSIDHDRPRLTDHVKAAWEHRDSNMTFMKILRDRKLPK